VCVIGGGLWGSLVRRWGLIGNGRSGIPQAK
jgi:hypothetical protein